VLYAALSSVQLESRKSDNDRLTSDLSTLRATHTQTTDALAAATRKAEHLERSNATLKTNLSVAQDAAEHHSQQNQRLSEELNGAKKQVMELSEEVDRQSSEKAAANKRVSELEAMVCQCCLI
jgi:chromosome segregation ATPase